MKPFSRRFSRITALCLAAVFTFTGAARGITTADEKKLADKFIKAIERQVNLIRDPLIVDYVTQMGERLTRVLPPQPFAYRFHVVNEPVYNAFAGPGGHIFVNSGLLADMESHHELAGILGHEISHVACRHISEKIDLSKKVGIATIAGLAAAIGLGIVGAGAAANAAMVGTIASGQSVMLAYSREDEVQADQVGLQYITDAGYDVEGLLDALKRIRGRQWFGKEQVPTYLMTHPALEERIGYVGSWLERRTDGLPGADPEEARRFRLAQNRLIALYLDPDTATRRLKDRLEARPGDDTSHYGYGLLLARIGDLENAEMHLKKALQARPLEPAYLTDLGQVAFLQGRYEEARRILSGALAIRPRYQDALFFMGRTHLALEDFSAALSVLETLSGERSDYPDVHYFMANAEEKMGRKDMSHYRLAFHYKEKGDWENALFQMKRALALSSDPQRKEEIRARMTEFEKEWKKEKDPSAAASFKP